MWVQDGDPHGWIFAVEVRSYFRSVARSAQEIPAHPRVWKSHAFHVLIFAIRVVALPRN